MFQILSMAYLLFWAITIINLLGSLYSVKNGMALDEGSLYSVKNTLRSHGWTSFGFDANRLSLTISNFFNNHFSSRFLSFSVNSSSSYSRLNRISFSCSPSPLASFLKFHTITHVSIRCKQTNKMNNFSLLEYIHCIHK